MSRRPSLLPSSVVDASCSVSLVTRFTVTIQVRLIDSPDSSFSLCERVVVRESVSFVFLRVNFLLLYRGLTQGLRYQRANGYY